MLGLPICGCPRLTRVRPVQVTNYTQLKREMLLAERAAREAAEAAECTFRPRLSGRAPRASAPGSGSTQAAGERLYQLAFRRSAELDAKRAEKVRFLRSLHAGAPLTPSPMRCVQSAASSGMTFRPDTSLSRRSRSESPGPRRPLHERVADLVRAQHAARASQAAQAAAQEAAIAPFKPRVDPVSAALAAQLHSSTAGPVPVVERLTGEASQARIASARAKAVALVAAEEECTFSPSVNATTERLVARMAALGRPADFVTRQAAYGTVAASHKAAVAAAAHTAAVSGGGGAADQVLGSSARYHHTLKETPEERARRLAVTDAQRREAERESRQQAVMEAECPFEPQLTEVTRKLAPQATPLRELVQDTRREAARAAAAAAAEEAVRQECTFAPDVRASTKSVRLSLPSAAAAPPASRASVFITHPDEAVAALREAAAARARQAELAAQERELQELASCTFRPQLVARQPRPASAGGCRPVLVRGYGSFMNRAANAVLLKREAEERERKVFLTDVSQRPPKTTHTVPQPFTLAFQQRAAERAAARAALEAQVESQRASQAPFRPTTNEGLLSQRLRRALAMSSE